MKKTLSLLLAFLIIFGIAAVGICELKPFTAEAAETLQEGNFVYTVVDGEAVITDYTDTESTAEIIIPEVLGGYQVTGIGAKAFCDCLCTSITISSTVEEIDAEAFAYNMPNLEKYVVAEGNSTFSSDKNGIIYEYIYGAAPIIRCYPKNSANKTFSYDTAFVSGVYAFAFSEVKNLEEVNINDTFATVIDNYAFYGAKDLKKIDINHCRYVGEKAFANCASLTDVDLGNEVQNIDWNAFEGTPFLEDPSKYDEDGVLYFDNYLIYALPEADREFYQIKEGTEVVAGGAFDWDSLTEVVIPKSVSHIGSNPFAHCANLKDITVSSGSDFLVDEYGVLYGRNGSELVSYPNGRYQSCYVVGTATDQIMSHAFDYSPVKNFYIPANVDGICAFGLGGDTVTDIRYAGDAGQWAACSVLEVVSDMTYMGRTSAVDVAEVHLESYSSDAHSILTKTNTKAVCSCGYESYFANGNGEFTENGFTYRIVNGKAEIVGCPSYVTGELVIPETLGGLTVIGIAKDAFEICQCTSVFIPSTVEYIDSGSALRGLSKLQKITVASGNAVYSSENGVLYSKDKSELLLYPRGKTDTSFTVPSYVEKIASNAFRSAYKLKSVTIPGNVKTVDKNAFAYMAGLSQLVVKSGVEYIGDYAFMGCTSLSSVTLAEGIKYIGRDVWYLTSFIADEDNYDSDGVFYYNNYILGTLDDSDVENYTVKSGTTLISGGAFAWEALEEIIIPAGVESIGDAAFNGCENLLKINVNADNEYYCSDESGVLFSKDKTVLAAYPMGRKQACYVVPEGVTEIRAYALDCNGKVSNKYIPDSVAVIGTYGIGANPEMIINYQGTQAEWSNIVFETDVNTESGYLNTIDEAIKIYGIYTAATHSLAYYSVVDPTCTEAGAENLVCSCGYKHVNVTPRNGHTAAGAKETVVSATCTEKQIQVRYCSVCGDAAETYIGSKLGHNYEESVREVSCTEDGGTFYKCSRCGDEYGENITPATGHKATEEIITIASTCTEDGGTYYKCEACGEPVGEAITVTPATGHTEGEWTVETQATCTKDGLEILPCTACGETVEFKVVEKSHNYTETVTEQTCTLITTKYHCTRCHDEYFSHKYLSGSHGELEEVVEEPGCFAYGKKYMRCTVCGATVGKVTQIPSEGHNWSEEITKAASCAEEGEKVTSCSKCGYSETEAIPKLSHTFGEWIYDSGNVFSGKCAVCDADFESIIVELTFDRNSFRMYNGNTEKVTATVTENISTDVIFVSSDENVVTVDSEGNIKATAPGTAVITARINGTDITASCTVYVLANTYLVNWLVDSDVYIVSAVNEGQKIAEPEPPEKEGYEFVGWTPEIPGVMPSHGLAFNAVFNKVSKSEEYDVSASYAQGCFDEEVDLDVAEVESQREPGGVYMVEGEYYKQVGLYNIKAVNAASEVVQPNTGYKVTIKLPIPAAYRSRTDFVINHRFVDGGREQLSTAKGTLTVKDGYLIFEVSCFSEFEILLPSANIQIAKLPDKTTFNYKVDDIDLSGIKLKVTKADGSIDYITDTKLMTVDGFDNTKIGTQTVTVRYGQYSDTLEVKVAYAWWQQIIRIFMLGFLWY